MRNIIYEGLPDGSIKCIKNENIVGGENGITRCSFIFPAEYTNFEKYVYFKVKKPLHAPGGKTNIIEILLLSDFYILPDWLIAAQIQEISLKAFLSDSNQIYTTVKAPFPLLGESLAGTGSSYLLPTAADITGTGNINVESKIVNDRKSIIISQNSPLVQKLQVGDIEGLEERLDSLETSGSEAIEVPLILESSMIAGDFGGVKMYVSGRVATIHYSFTRPSMLSSYKAFNIPAEYTPKLFDFWNGTKALYLYNVAVTSSATFSSASVPTMSICKDINGNLFGSALGYVSVSLPFYGTLTYIF